jgi:hypothetical protein
MAVKNLTAAELEVLATRLHDIAIACLTLRDAGQRVICDAEGEDSSFNGSAIVALAVEAGAIADHCVGMLGDELGGVCGDFIEWRMSPLEREQVERVKQRSNG